MAGLSQAALGIKAGIDQSAASPRINQYEKGKHAPDYLTVERLAEALDVPVPFLYCREDALAELILLFGSLTKEEQGRWLEKLKVR